MRTVVIGAGLLGLTTAYFISGFFNSLLVSGSAGNVEKDLT